MRDGSSGSAKSFPQTPFSLQHAHYLELAREAVNNAIDIRPRYAERTHAFVSKFAASGQRFSFRRA